MNVIPLFKPPSIDLDLVKILGKGKTSKRWFSGDESHGTVRKQSPTKQIQVEDLKGKKQKYTLGGN